MNHAARSTSHSSLNSVDSVSLTRRSLLAAAGVGLSQLLLGCDGQSGPTLNVRSLSGAVPPQIINEFRKTLGQSGKGVNLKFSPEPQLQTLFTRLQTWKQSGEPAPGWLDWLPFGDRPPAGIPDLVLLGNYWLENAIQQQLIQPIDLKPLKTWPPKQKDDRWQALVQRDRQGNPDPKGEIWGIPHRWGTTVIAYRSDVFQKRGWPPPQDWSDLWRPELRGRVSLLDNAREVIGFTLKKLGRSYNTSDLNSVPDLERELQTLHQQVKLYSSDAYQQPLLLEETWVALGWSTDILPLMQRSGQVAAIVPRSGTALWAEMWVHPAGTPAALSALATEWLNFCWQPTIAMQLSLLSRATAPAVLTIAPDSLTPDLRNNPLLLPNAKTLQASEFLQPLPDRAIEQYRTLWRRIRQAT